ncbi:MAG TPA: UDP-4-amino-4,6-dideoxy-N-acetyl-beta-L-altrosamine N-acetyltransferase [Sulfurimonas sp.]|uniref:UDP-4-amino-4, 6-dideoxy-N-acetyl-beta-L-altrosamine N-acetyltransferase n=1 Tax=Sulfurimonas sp. TaxID=2022749 RepID=UPI002BEFFFFA|nr:UDP-4-amino-4,6-dideoxy-N-acetyl-beta-L-altrosamine N-acetyltransferase [Sulfurimonas sp.]HUH42992.1 UDP-4-amino-4,6-dideoxy-N-acetyl-beta-L-altrosamine N-acetyltransferase [Sulfurimonas sp.]
MKDILLVNFIDLTIEEKKLILSWRNHSDIKKWMYTTQAITLEEHLKFIDTLKNSKDKKYFVIKNKDIYLGVIDFYNITKNSVKIGLYKNPQVQNIGKLLLDTLLQYSFDILKVDVVISEVFQSNEKAYKLYLSIGFKSFGSKIINNKKVICMELKRENW